MTELAKRDELAGLMAEVRRTLGKTLTGDELRLFALRCQQTGLDPFGGQIYAVKRFDARLQREVLTIQVGIAGLRLIAERTGKYAGQIGPDWCGEDGEWKDVWLSEKPPAAARVGVLRKDFAQPLFAVALWREYAQHDKKGGITSMWLQFPALMLAKCAEALAIRRAFPAETSGLYIREEMMQATVEEEEVVAPPEAPGETPVPTPTAEAQKEEAIPPKLRDWHTHIASQPNLNDLKDAYARAESLVEQGRLTADDFAFIKKWSTARKQQLIKESKEEERSDGSRST